MELDTSTPSDFYDGIIDEVRVSKVSRSNDWIKATYYSNWDELNYIECNPITTTSTSTSTSTTTTSTTTTSISTSGTCNIYISSDKIDSDLINFPLLINISSSAGVSGSDMTDIFDTIGSDYTKLKVLDSSNNILYTEVERWDHINESAQLWVKVPTISSSTDTVLTIEYDNSISNSKIGTTNTSAAQNVWDDDFVLVYHMSQNPTGGILYDSTSNNSSGAFSGNMNSDNLVDGLIGKALKFYSGNDKIDIISSLTLPSTWTVEAMSYLLSTPSDYSGIVVVDKNGLIYENSTYTWGAIDNDVLNAVYNSSVSLNQYYYLVATSGSSLYVDSVKATDTASDQNYLIPNSISLGYNNVYTSQICDEVRISKVVRSDAWIKATYYSNWDNLNYIE